MFQKNKLKIMELFFEEPNREFHLREISRESKIAVTSTKKYLEEIEKESLIIKNNKGIYPCFSVNQENNLLKTYKTQNMILKIEKSGLLEYLEEKINPQSIVLYGSIRKGEYNKKSDIDLFIQANEKEIETEKYERILKHKIHLLFEKEPKKLSSNLLNNMINGIKLRGYLMID